MKKFSPDAIKSRYVSNLRLSESWPSVLADSSVDSFITSSSEMEAELARYFEYLLQESKWGVARNISSLLTQSQYLGYKYVRSQSSIGYVTISHNALLQDAGISGVSDIFTVEDCTTYLTSGYTGNSFTIGRGTPLFINSIPFVVTQDTTYGNGVCFVTVPVAQGTVVPPKLITVYGNSFEKIKINKSNIEAGISSLSGNFFSVSFTYGNTTEVCKEYKDIYLASYLEYAYDVNSSLDGSTLTIRFGNGIAGKKLPSNSVVSITYLETLGENGNVSDLYADITIAQSFPQTLYGKNFNGLLGGKASSTIDDIRADAPYQYILDGGGVITSNDYKAIIDSIPSVLQSTVYYGVSTVLSKTKDTIYYSAIDTEGNAFNSVDINNALTTIIEGKNSPFDYYMYANPLFIHLKLNVYGFQLNANQATLSANISEGLYAKYGSLQQKFYSQFDESELIAYVYNTYNLQNTRLLLEAVTDLYPSDFAINPISNTHYIKEFVFDKSFVAIKSFNDGVKYCLKINVVFNADVCSECVPKNRTIFVVEDGNSYSLKQYPYISNITSTSYMENYVFNESVVPNEIVKNNGSTEMETTYIDFKLNLDLNSFAASSGTDLVSGSFEIPIAVDNNGGNPYINFTNPEMNNGVEIQVIGEPVSHMVLPVYNNNIIRINSKDINVEVSS